MQVQGQVEEQSGAETFAAHLDRRWGWRRTDDQTDAVIRAIRLVSAPRAWPSTVRIEFTTNGRDGIWDERWAEYFAQITWEAFPEMQATGYAPDGLRFLDQPR